MSRAGDIIDKARAETRLEHFDSESFREGLELAAEALDANPLRTEQGRGLIEHMYVVNLSNRLKIANYARLHPEVLQEAITQPVFILGMPRTGTTLVSYLLGADRQRRSLLRWEVAHPVPPPTLGNLYANPHIDAMNAFDEHMRSIGASLDKIHYEAPDGPTECTFVMAHDFKSLFVEAMSAYAAYSNWYLKADLASAYEYHKLVLQILQSRAPGIWTLKLPSHALGVNIIRRLYPDARFIWTHRDPYRATSSLMSMISKAQRLSLSRSDYEHVRSVYPRQMAEHLNRPMAFMDANACDPFVHVMYSDLLRDPIGEMRKVYGKLGDEFTPQAEAGMTAWLKENPQGRFGSHEHGLEEFGLTPEDLTPWFEGYLKRFDLEMET
jgi:hypothetical protein